MISTYYVLLIEKNSINSINITEQYRKDIHFSLTNKMRFGDRGNKYKKITREQRLKIIDLIIQ